MIYVAMLLFNLAVLGAWIYVVFILERDPLWTLVFLCLFSAVKIKSRKGEEK